MFVHVCCHSDCRVTDRHSTVTQSTEIPTITSPGPGGMVVTMIVVVVILILGCFFAAFWLWKKRGVLEYRGQCMHRFLSRRLLSSVKKIHPKNQMNSHRQV
ncbi:hypothetical protein JZ751_009921 [Albula glossodonta]|uniref:Uncharacterized protein n=1 Tax=Albula glossodonta TaxID=121402 RepID=A0A8T2NYZ6_9TELE|nr:hypothetical protein JZ751_009921 [Albula glossodonta]